MNLRSYYLSFIICHLSFSSVAAQDLWITGTAVPGGTQKLEKVSDNDYKYAGRLNAGELQVSTSKKPAKGTLYLTPVVADASLVNNGITYFATTDAQAAAWQVLVSEDRYRVHVNTDQKVFHGELFQPWGELFIAGGATEVGWKSEGKMLLMKQSPDNPCVWTWEGELKRHPEVEEPASFKFQGQDRWHPKSLHPYRQGVDVLNDSRLRTGGDDTKWDISRDGHYRISIDLFHETIHAELIDQKH